MYYDRFGNTVDYMVANYPSCIASMSMGAQRALAENQAAIDYPCCNKYLSNMVLPYINPNVPCCPSQCWKINLKQMGRQGFGNLNPGVLGSVVTAVGGSTSTFAYSPVTGCCGN